MKKKVKEHFMWDAVILLCFLIYQLHLWQESTIRLCVLLRLKGSWWNSKFCSGLSSNVPSRESPPQACVQKWHFLHNFLIIYLVWIFFLSYNPRLKPYHIPICLFNTSLSQYNVSSSKAYIFFLLFTSKFPMPKFVSCTWMALFSWAPKSL